MGLGLMPQPRKTTGVSHQAWSCPSFYITHTRVLLIHIGSTLTWGLTLPLAHEHFHFLRSNAIAVPKCCPQGLR